MGGKDKQLHVSAYRAAVIRPHYFKLHCHVRSRVVSRHATVVAAAALPLLPQQSRIHPVLSMDTEWEPYIMGLRPRQVLLVNTYNFIPSSGTHQQFTQFHIRGRMDIPDEYDASPTFLRHEWNANWGEPRPKWMDYVNHPPGTTSWSVNRLANEVRKCSRYCAIWENQHVVRIFYITKLLKITQILGRPRSFMRGL
ncbi:hypothetical protein B0H12DRAFT_1125018 [Mycena haematopus]|nr:hypothetical protein B0H12DRAFT_1125018 [Mycena haematopus]